MQSMMIAAIFLMWLTASATVAEIVLWPEAVPGPRVPAVPAEPAEMGKDGTSDWPNRALDWLRTHW